MIQKVSSVERQISNNCFLCESIPVPAFYFEVRLFFVLSVFLQLHLFQQIC